MSESPREYIEELKAQNKALRSGLAQMCRERQVLEEYIAQQNVRILELRRRYGLAAHDFEPEVD